MPRTLVSLFTGAGGLDIGLERAGFRTLAAVDFDSDCLKTLRRNQAAGIPIVGHDSDTHLAESRLLMADIADIGAADLVDRGADVDLLVGGPPCQPFSSAGSQRSLDDPRGQLFSHFVRLASELRPRAILFENVRGLVTARGPHGVPGEALDAVIRGFESVGYSTTCRLLNAADYGSPQRRVRFFMMAVRTGELPFFPAPTHSKVGSDAGLLPWISLGDFLRTCQEPDPDEVVRPSEALELQLRGLPNGTGLRSPGRAEPTRPGGHWGYKQGTFVADPSKPARTVTAASTQDWIRLTDGTLRRITLSEAAGLQGFPGAWRFEGPRSSQFRQIGNAVPAVFGERLGAVLAEALETRSPVSGDRPASAPLPKEFASAIAYTARDDSRNGHVRPRSPRFAKTSA
jgi:DNA (cytosine-5)-methyltransferase 1